jgi:hypothetical protein
MVKNTENHIKVAKTLTKLVAIMVVVLGVKKIESIKCEINIRQKKRTKYMNDPDIILALGILGIGIVLPVFAVICEFISCLIQLIRKGHIER